MKTIVYIDGFNFYYGAVKGTPFKWLNLHELCRVLLPKNEIVQIKYFTAKIKGRPDDPNQQLRQQIFLRALKTLPNFEIFYGHFLSHIVPMRVAHPKPGEPRFIEVIKTEEKGSDVNLAVNLLNDAYKGLFEVAAIISNDSDLLEPIRIVQRELGLTVGIINPQRSASRVLAREAAFVIPIRKWALKKCQFPERLRDSKGEIRKPKAW